MLSIYLGVFGLLIFVFGLVVLGIGLRKHPFQPIPARPGQRRECLPPDPAYRGERYLPVHP